MTRIWTLGLVTLLALAGPSGHLIAQTEALEAVLPPDGIPSIDHPRFESATRTHWFVDDEPVIGVVGEREQRAYSEWTLDTHEIVNDVLDGQPVAITWCPLCGTAIVYARTVGSRTLTFGVSGMLYHDALVMYDRETGSLWSQVDGHAIKGALAGHTLSPRPSIQATWKEWKGLYPDSLVLEKAENGGFRSSYETYNRSSRLGIFGRKLTRSAFPPKERVLGVRFNDEAIAFAVKGVRQTGLVQVEVGGVPVLLASTDPDLPIVAFERRVAGR